MYGLEDVGVVGVDVLKSVVEGFFGYVDGFEYELGFEGDVDGVVGLELCDVGCEVGVGGWNCE